MVEMFHKRLRGVFSYRTAIPVLDDENPGFVFSWHETNVGALVTAANGLNSAQAPGWLRTLPPHITTESFIDVIHRLQPVAGGRVAWVLLAPNTQEQLAAIHVRLAMLQAHAFMQAAAQVAFPVVNTGAQYLATTYVLRAQRARPNRLEAVAPHGLPRQLFA